MKHSYMTQPCSNSYFPNVNLFLKTFYLGTAASILFAYKIPLLRNRFLAYGARNAVSQSNGPNASRGLKSKKISTSLRFAHPFDSLTALFDFLAALQVPHSWFMSFYLISVFSSMLWGQQLLTHGPLYWKIASSTEHPPASMSLNSIAVSWALMAFQGIRRLLE